jgi:hypothetical protein
MDGKHHLQLYYLFLLPFFIALIVYQLYYVLPLTLLAFQISDSDEDQKIAKGRYHRWFFTHSLLYPLMIWIVIYICPPQHLLPVLVFATIIHLAGDLFGTKGWEGKALLMWFNKRMTKVQSIAWLSLNIIGGILICYFFLGM